MKVKFTGSIERSSGCGCGGARNNTKSFRTSKLYILPSGESKMFYANRTAEVSDSDGNYLLQYKEFERG